MNQLDYIDIHRILPTAMAGYMIFSSAPRMFSKIDRIFKIFRRIEI